MRDPAPAQDPAARAWEELTMSVGEILALVSQEAVVPANALPLQRFEWASPWLGGSHVRMIWTPPPYKGRPGRLSVELLANGSTMVWRTQVNVHLVELDG